MHVAKCKLCHELRPLISRSHIIPNFLYRPLYDEKHRLGFSMHSETQAEFALRQTGAAEAGLFCADCDNRRLGSLEKYVAENIYRPLEKRARSAVFAEDEHLLPHRLQVDYAKTKLFFLSLLFRMSISKDPFFSAVNLGPHEERLRKRLLSEDAGPANRYQIALICYLTAASRKFAPHSVMPFPKVIRDASGWRYVFVAPGFYHMFQVSNHATEATFNRWTPLENGEFPCLIATPERAGEWLNVYIGHQLF